MDYARYSVEDLLMDDYFLGWVNQPTAQSERFWQGFLAQHPHRSAVVGQARLHLLDLQHQLQDSWDVSSAEMEEMWRQVQAGIRSSTNPSDCPFSRPDTDEHVC